MRSPTAVSVGPAAYLRQVVDVDDFLSSNSIFHGEPNEIKSFLQKAIGAVSARGLSLSFEPLHELARINAANRESWRPLIPLFDTRHGIADDSAFCLVGRNGDGEIVATQAARVYDWATSNFQDEAQSLRLFYARPEKSSLANETCEVTAPNARNITGRVVFSGGGWYRPDYRKQWLSGLLPRISRVLAHAHWGSAFTISIMAEAVINGGMAARCGYTNVEYDVLLRGGPVGDVRCALVWMATHQLRSDMVIFNQDGIPVGAAPGEGRKTATQFA